MTGTVLEEGLRGAGGYLLNGAGERFMQRVRPARANARRATSCRAASSARLRAGHTTPNGGVYLQMHHLGADNVRQRFKGMVERCADCGFDLAGGLVEVVPTAHYMMGGVVFDADCATTLPGLFAAGEDTGGVHGANRLGGNGVANSTVFGGIAGDTHGGLGAARTAYCAAADDGRDQRGDRALHERPLRAAAPATSSRSARRSFDCMWNDVGILRDADGLERARRQLGELDAQLDADRRRRRATRAFNLRWHDWLNLRNLIVVSRAITESALVREDSRGAHYREDFPEAGDLETSEYMCLRLEGERFAASRQRVQFTRVRPGESLLEEESSAVSMK